ncbi:MAG: UbiH/UbiF/VisC/COQ6 family ubiquinone biosynthesis hydroxylase, partial [Alphaproteobacteria bacterium]
MNAIDTAPGGRTVTADALIVGGGLVGLSLAIALARAGLAVTVVDRADPGSMTDARADGRTTAIAHASARVLDGIGVWPTLAAEACAIDDIRVSDGDSLMFVHYDHRELGDDPLGHIVENHQLRRALLDAARETAGLDLRAPAAVAALDRTGDGVAATLADGTAVRAEVVLACDGRGSAIRRDAGIAVAEWRYRQTAIVCCMRHERPHRHIAHERFLPGGPFAILPMNDDAAGNHRSSIVWSEREGRVPALLALDPASFSLELAQRVGGFLGEVSLDGERWSYPLSLSHAVRYTDRRLALVGDAAHAIHPIAGQGLNMGIRDVAALAEVLVETRRLGLDIGTPDVLARYARWRRADNTMLAVVTDLLNRLFSNDIAPLRLARDLGLAAVD